MNENIGNISKYDATRSGLNSPTL